MYEYDIQFLINEEYGLNEVKLIHSNAGFDIISDLLESGNVILNTQAPYFIVSGTSKYFVGYYNANKEMIMLKFEIWYEEHSDIGIATATCPTEDAILFWTDHSGRFRIFVFPGLKAITQELYASMVNGSDVTTGNELVE